MIDILGLIGLSKKAGKLSAGTFACETSIKSHDAKLIIIATDASHNSKKTIKDSCSYYKVPFVEFSDMDSLGKYSGGGQKAAVSVNDDNFATAIKQKIEMVQRKDR